MAYYTPEPDENGCRTWTGSVDRHGYGLVSRDGASGMHMAHRIAYEMAGNDLGCLPIHHKCANKLCVEPSHLVAVEPHENTAEMFGRIALGKHLAALENALAEFCPDHPLLG